MSDQHGIRDQRHDVGGDRVMRFSPEGLVRAARARGDEPEVVLRYRLRSMCNVRMVFRASRGAGSAWQQAAEHLDRLEQRFGRGRVAELLVRAEPHATHPHNAGVE